MTGPGVPVPVEVTELVVRALRPLLAGCADPVAAGAQVSTETGRSSDGGPPVLPWLLVVEDSHTWDWPAVQRAVIRLTCWHHDTRSAKTLVALALGLLCTPSCPGRCAAANPSPPSRRDRSLHVSCSQSGPGSPIAC